MHNNGSFIELFTKNEEQEQYFLQIFDEYHRRFPDHKKQFTSQRQKLLVE